jgi:hypothetical protein
VQTTKQQETPADTPLPASDGKRPRRKTPALRFSSYGYGIVREIFTLRNGDTAGLWYAHAKRQNREIQRNFHDQPLGGPDAALTLALAWRDALLRLIPPETKRQRQTQLKSNNTSGVTGVFAWRLRGRLLAWRAELATPERIYLKNFSVRTYGEKRAKELAIAERERLLETYGVKAFSTTNAQATRAATQHFGHLLDDDPQPAVMHAQWIASINALNYWFDQLRPYRLDVRLKVYFQTRDGISNTPIVYLNIASTGVQTHRTKKCFLLVTRSYAQRLPELWQFIQKAITAWHGLRRWQAFEARHRDAFMASPLETGFQSCDYYAPPGYPQCRQPPAALLPMLAGFEVPELNYQE